MSQLFHFLQTPLRIRAAPPLAPCSPSPSLAADPPLKFRVCRCLGDAVMVPVIDRRFRVLG